MSRRHRRSVTSARRHLTTAIGFAALGSLSPTTIEVPLQSKDDEPYPRAFLGSFLWGTATAAYSKARGTKMARESRSGTGSRTPRKSRTAIPAKWPRTTFIGTGEDVQLVTAFGPTP